MSQYDFLLSEKPDVESTLLPYSKWSEQNAVPDQIESRKQYADYLRSSYLDAGGIDENTEQEIRNGLYGSLVNSGVIEDSEESKKALFSAPEATLDEKLQDTVDSITSDSPDWEPIVNYIGYRKAVQPDSPESFLEMEESRRLAAEEALGRSYQDALRIKIKNNEIPFAKVTNEKGETELLTSDLAAQMPLKDALAQSKRYGVDLSDAYLAQESLKVHEGYSLPAYKLNRVAQAAAMIQELSKEDEDLQADIDGYSRRLAMREYDRADIAEMILDEAGQDVVDIFKRVLGKGEEVDKDKAFRKKASFASTTAYQTTAANVAKKLNTTGALTDGEGFTLEEVGTALNELGLRNATDKGYFQYHDGADEIGRNIRAYGIGLPYVSPSLMANETKFEEALAARKDIPDSTKQKMRDQKEEFLTKEFQQYSEVLQRSSNGEQWLNELQKGRANGIADKDILKSYLSNPDNYNEFSERAKSFTMSVVNGFLQPLAIGPAYAGSEFAQEYLANVAQKNSDRREVANLFGADFGIGQDVAETFVPMFVDAGASSLLRKATSPLAKAASATFMAAKQGARPTFKSFSKGIVSDIFSPLAGETKDQAAKRLLNEGLIKQAAADGGMNGAMAAVNGAASQIADRLSGIPASFIPAAARQMGSSYGTLFNEFKKDPNISREEAHDRAMGASMLMGAVTGLITSGFSAIGRSGFEEAFTKGLSYRQLKTLFGRLTNSADNISDAATKEVIKSSLKETFKKHGWASIGKEVSKDAFDEFTEEGIDTFVNSFVEDAALDENTPMIERAKQSVYSGFVGGIIGTSRPAITAAIGTIDRRRRAAIASNVELDAIRNVTKRLGETGSPLTEQIVTTLLTGPVRRQQAMAEVLRRRAEAAAAPVDTTAATAAAEPQAPKEEQLELPLTGETPAVAPTGEAPQPVTPAVTPTAVPTAAPVSIIPTPEQLDSIPVKNVGEDNQDNFLIGDGSARVVYGTGGVAIQVLVPSTKGGYRVNTYEVSDKKIRVTPSEILTPEQEQQFRSGTITEIPSSRLIGKNKTEETKLVTNATNSYFGFDFLAEVKKIQTKANEVDSEESYNVANQGLLDLGKRAIFARTTAPTATPAATPTVRPTATQLELPLGEAKPKELTANELIKNLSNVSPEDVKNLIPVILPEEVKASGQLDLGLYIRKADATKEPTMVPFNVLPFGRKTKQVMEQLDLDFDDVIKTEISDTASKPTIIEMAELPSDAQDGIVVGTTLDQFVGEEEVKAAEMSAFNLAAQTGYPISFRTKARYGMPKRDVSEKATGKKSYYRSLSDELAKTIYKNFPIKKYVLPTGGSEYTSNRTITYYDPVTKKRVSSKSVKGFIDINGNGLFNNDPVLVAEMLRDGVPVKVPHVFEQKINPAFVIRNRRVVDVLGPRPDGKAGLISMTTPIESSLTSEPDYQSLIDASNLSSIFLDDAEAQRVIPSGAQVVDRAGKVNNIGSMPTSVGEVLNNFNVFISNSYLPTGEGVPAEEVAAREAAFSKVRELLRLRNGSDLQDTFYDTAVQAMHVEYINLVNQFEIRSSLIASNIAVETPTGYKINPAKNKAAMNLFMARLKPDKKTEVAKRLAPFVKASEEEANSKPNDVILSFLDSQVLNNTRFEGNTMPTLNQVANTVKGRYADQQKTREIEEKTKVTTSMDPAVMDQVAVSDFQKEATYIGEPSISESEPLSASEISRVLKQADFDAISSIDEDPDLREALNDLLFQSVYKNPTTTQVTRVTNMTTTDAFGTLANWIAKGNFNNPEVLKFEQSLTAGEFRSGLNLRLALSISRLSSRASTSEDPTADAEYVAVIRAAMTRSLGFEVSTERAKNVIRAIDKGIRKRFSRSHITQAQSVAANRFNNADVSRLGLESGDPETVIEALKQIAKSSDNESHKLVANLLLEDTAFIKTVRFEIGEADFSYAGEYNRLVDGSHSVFLNMNGHNGRGLENVLLEEYVHAFLSDVANKPKEFLTRNQAEAVARLNGLMELVRKQADRDGINDPSLMDGLANIDEFIANFLLSQNFQALVKTVQPPKGQRGFFARIIDAIVGIFRKVNAKEQDLYSDALKDILDLSRSAMRLERNSSAALMSSVSEYASDILNRASAVREALPEAVKAKFMRAEEPVLSTEEQLKNVNQTFYTSVNRELARQQQSITEENVPKSVTETDADQVKRARSLMTLIRSIVPYEVRLNFLKPEEVANITARGEARFVASATGDKVDIDLAMLMAEVENMDNLTANILVESFILEELGHVASYNALPQSVIDEIANSFNQSELDAIADSYYRTEKDRADAKARTKSDEINDRGVRVDLDEKRRLTEEYLRSHLQRVTNGYTTEENAAFLRTNPSLFKIMLRYIGGVFRRMAGARTGNPKVDIALTRMLNEIRGLKMGYRTRPSRLRFDPNNPAASMEAFRMLTGLDNLDQIELDGFDEDFAEAMYAQISLEDFKRIQQYASPDRMEQLEYPTENQKVVMSLSDMVLFLRRKFGDESVYFEQIVDGFEDEFNWNESADGELTATASNVSMFSDYNLIGPTDNPEELYYLAGLEFLKRRIRTEVAQYIAEEDLADWDITEPFIEEFAKLLLIDASDLGMGPQLIIDHDVAETYSGQEITITSDSVASVHAKTFNPVKLGEVLQQIDGLKIVTQNGPYISARLTRGNKDYKLSFSILSGGRIDVGNLVPVETNEGSGETVSADSFGIELLLALVSNNHLIGATEISTYAAGSAYSIRKEIEGRPIAIATAAARGEQYQPKMIYKGFKAWAKLGFDAMLSDADVKSMAREYAAYKNASESERQSIVESALKLAEDADGGYSVAQLVHLSEDPKYGAKLWDYGGSGTNMRFDLKSGSKSLQAFSRLIERMVKIKGLVPEVKQVRESYSRQLKGLSVAEISEQEKANKEKQIKDNYVQKLNELGINPDRLLTSLGSGTAFSGSSVKFDALIETLDMPMFEAGTYKAPTAGLMRAFMGELDPRFTRLDDNRNAFIRAATHLVERYHGTINKLVEKRYGSVANAPTELIAEAMGSTGIEVSEEVYDRIEDDHTERLVDIRSDDTLTADQKSAAIIDSARMRDDAIAAAKTAARDLAIKRKDMALTKLTEQAPEIAKHIVDLRDKLIDPLSKKLKDLYGVTEELGIYMDSQLGLYMTRAYRMFTEVGFAERVKNDPLYQDVRDEAMDFFDKQFVKFEKRRLEREGILPAEAEKQAEEALLNKRSSSGESYGQQALAAFIESYATKNDIGFGGAKMGEGYRVMLDNLKNKKDIPPALRAVLGEYKNSEEGTNNLLRTFVTVSTMAANQSFLNNVRTLGERNGFIITSDEYHANKSKYEGYVPFRSSKTAKYDPLLGTYAPKEMVEGFQKTFDANTIQRNASDAMMAVDKGMTLISKATGYAMAAKTLGSVGFYFRNVISNMMFFGPSQGFFRIDKMIKVAAEQSWKGMRDQNRIDEYIAELTAMNIVNDSIQANIIKELINGKVDPSGIMKQLENLMDKTQLSKGTAALKLVGDKASRLAAHADAIYKIAYYEFELGKLKEAQRISNTGSVAGMSEYQLKRMAADKVLMTAQSASQAPPIVSQLTKSGLGLQFAPFLRFRMEVPRIIVNTYKLARKEMKDANPAIKRRGQWRFASMTGMLGGVSMAIPTALRALISGIDDEEDEALRNSIPEYLRGNTFYYFGSGDSLTSINLTFVNPFSMNTDPVLRSMEQIFRGNFGQAAVQFVRGMIFDGYLDEQILAGTVLDTLKNRNSTTGEPIWEENIDGVFSTLLKSSGYIFDNAYSPRLLSDAIKAYGAIGGDYTEFDDSPIGIMMSGVYPARIHDVDLNKQFSRYLREKKQQFDRITTEKYALYGERPVDNEAIRELYDDEVKNRKLLNQDLLKTIRGFEGLGMSRAEIYRDMTTRGGISKRRAALLFNNIMDRPDLNKGFLKGLLEKEYGLERANVLVDQLGNYSRYMFIEE